MYTGQTISLKEIMWKVMRNPLVSEMITYEDAGEFALEAIRLLGAPLALIDKTSKHITVEAHKAALPENIIQLKGIRKIQNKDDYEDCPIPLTYSTNTFHSSENCELKDIECPEEYTYTVNKGIVFSSFSEGYIQVAYKTLPLDDEGFPLVQDDQDTKLAIEYYILYRFLEPLWLIGKITDKAFAYINQKKCWYMSAASTSLKIQSMDHVEAIMNVVNRLIINTNAHKNSFKGAGTKERFQRYN